MAPFSTVITDRKRRGKKTSRHIPESAFTLVEVLVSSIVLLVAVVGSITAFNLITLSVRGTGLRADQSRRIDDQIAEVNRRIEAYTACFDPAGSLPNPIPDPGDAIPACGNQVLAGNSFYYIPDPATPANLDAFFVACSDGTITNNFMAVIDDVQDDPDGVVDRQQATRVDAADPDNYLVQITWVDPARNNRLLRTIQVSPIVAGWCP